MFCFNEVCDQTGHPQVLGILKVIAVSVGCSPYLARRLCSFICFNITAFPIFCPTACSQGLREPKTKLRLCITLWRFGLSPQSTLCGDSPGNPSSAFHPHTPAPLHCKPPTSTAPRHLKYKSNGRMAMSLAEMQASEHTSYILF